MSCTLWPSLSRWCYSCVWTACGYSMTDFNDLHDIMLRTITLHGFSVVCINADVNACWVMLNKLPLFDSLNIWLLHCVSCLSFTQTTFVIYTVFVLRFVYIWDTTSRRILYKLPGHAGSVNEVVFHPEEPVGEWNHSQLTHYKTCH